jgi:hypothetical protein
MIGKSSGEPSLKLHLLRLEMQLLYRDVKYLIWRCNYRARTISKRFIYCNYSILSMIYCIGGRCCCAAVLGRKVSINAIAQHLRFMQALH